MGSDSRNFTKTQGRTCGIPEAGDKEEDAKARGEVLAEGGGGQRASCIGDTTSKYLH